MLHINKNDVYLIENQKQTEKKSEVIKTYIQFTRPNIVKTGSEQMQQMYFLFFLLDIQFVRKRFFSDYWIIQLLNVAFVDRHMNQIIIF